MGMEGFKEQNTDIEGLRAEVERLEQEVAKTDKDAGAAHDGLFSGETTESILDIAYRRHHDAIQALNAAKEKLDSAMQK